MLYKVVSLKAMSTAYQQCLVIDDVNVNLSARSMRNRHQLQLPFTKGQDRLFTATFAQCKPGCMPSARIYYAMHAQHIPHTALLGRRASPNARQTLPGQCYKSSSWFIAGEETHIHTLLPHVMHQLWPYVCEEHLKRHEGKKASRGWSLQSAQDVH